jgi:hypothetical protein
MQLTPAAAPILTPADFEPLIGGDFIADATPEPINIRLDEVARRATFNPAFREPFTLIFSTPWSTLLIEGNYRLRTPRGNSIELFLNPTLTPPGERRFYHAVFT